MRIRARAPDVKRNHHHQRVNVCLGIAVVGIVGVVGVVVLFLACGMFANARVLCGGDAVAQQHHQRRRRRQRRQCRCRASLKIVFSHFACAHQHICESAASVECTRWFVYEGETVCINMCVVVVGVCVCVRVCIIMYPMPGRTQHAHFVSCGSVAVYIIRICALGVGGRLWFLNARSRRRLPHTHTRARTRMTIHTHT